jgi:hypothetical protein
LGGQHRHGGHGNEGDDYNAERDERFGHENLPRMEQLDCGIVRRARISLNRDGRAWQC